MSTDTDTPTALLAELWRAAEAGELPLVVLADALEEDGDPAAVGVRMLGEAGKRPTQDYPHEYKRNGWDWLHSDWIWPDERPLLPIAWWCRLSGSGIYDTYRDAVLDAARTATETDDL